MPEVLKGLFGDPILKIIALIIGFLLWFLASIERTYQYRTKICTEIMPADSGYVLSNIIPDSIEVIFQGKGSRLIPIKIRPPVLIIDLKGKKIGSYNLSLSKEYIFPSLAREIRIEFLPRKVQFRLAKESRRNANLWVPVDGKPKSNYMISAIKNPEKVVLVGAKSLLVGINEVLTETLSIENASGRIDTTLKIIPPSRLIKTIPQRVPVSVNIEMVAEKTFSNLPLIVERNRRQLVSIDPERATITIKGPESQIKNLDQSKISINIDVKKFTKGLYELPAQITLPAGFDLVNSDPKIFKVKIK